MAEAVNGAEAVELAREHRPDVALIDVQMPVMDGIEATHRIVADTSLTRVHVVVLTNYGLDEYVFTALRAGASGFLLKDNGPTDLLQALRVAVRGDALLVAGGDRTLISEFVPRPANLASSSALDVLTPRELEVVALVAQGLSNDEIADGRCSAPPRRRPTSAGR